MPRDKFKAEKAKKVYPFKMWRVILGGLLLIPAIFIGFMYIRNPEQYTMAYIMIVVALPAGYFLWTGFNHGESGHILSKKKTRGDENCLLWIARHNPDTERDIPFKVMFVHIEQKYIPKGTRLKYCRNLKRHVYELTWDTEKKRLVPTILPDKKPLTPQLYVLPATMQPFKDWHDFSPPSMLQKVAPGVLMLVMVIIGILMVVTGPQPGA